MTSDTPVRWGILATGKIAHSFARDLAVTPGAELAAVGSRRQESADAFAAEFGDRTPIRAHGSYEDLVADPEVDVVYIATPHTLHLENARLAFEAGKHVLCEKPITIDTADAEEMVALARQHDRFFMEAMWSACQPSIIGVRRRLAAGEFGTPRHFHAELGFVVQAGPGDRMVDPSLGASALLDMGIYPLTLAHLFFGEAESVRAVADTVTAPGGTFDTDVAMVGRYPGGVLATMTASITSWSSRASAIATDAGRLDLFDFHHPSGIVWTPKAPVGDWTREQAVLDPIVVEPDPALDGEVIGAGYGNEIAEVGRCIREGLRESPLVPHAQTLTLLRQMDDVRRQVGVNFV